MSATLITPPNFAQGNKFPGVLVVHGLGPKSSSKGYLPLARQLAEAGFVVLAIDLRGHGKSPGRLNRVTRQDHLLDIVVARNYLSQRPKVSYRIIGLGASYGAYLLTLVSQTQQYSFDGLILRAPASYPDSRWDAPIKEVAKNPWLKAFRRRSAPKQNAGYDALRHYQGQVLVISGGKDTIVPPQTIQNYLAAAKGNAFTLKHKQIKGAEHNLQPKDHAIVDRVILDWTRRFLKYHL